MNLIHKNIDNVRRRVQNACKRVGRNPADVRILLATKTISPERIKVAFEYGETLIGENKVQEVVQKYTSLKDIEHEKHFIGHLQTNKIKDILRSEVSCIQSLDSLKLAQKLHTRLFAENRTINALVQVNTSGESSKYGISPQRTVDFVRELEEFNTIKVKGLMTIGLYSSDFEKVRTCFRILSSKKQEIEKLGISNVEMTELSMGMSGDLEIAIEEGATIIRIGSAIFGDRNY